MKHALRYCRPVASMVAVALFAYLLKRTGWHAIADDIRVLGWGAAALVLLSGLRHLLRALAWSYCVQTDGWRPSALSLLGPRLMGEALNDLTPAGPLLGEPAKIAVVSKMLPAHDAASSVILENLIYALGAVAFMLSGLVVALGALAATRGSWWISGGLISCTLAVVALACWIVTRRILLMGRTLDYFKRFGLYSAFLERHEQSVRAVEQTIYEFFLSNRRTFASVLAIEIATNFTGVAEAYLILNATAGHTSLLAAYLVESASRAVQLAFSFIPLGLGIQEGAASVTLRALGYAASQGVSLALIRKVRSLFWAAIGLLFAAQYSTVLPAAEKRAAQS